jgi:transcriptional regulator of acetoin/glycerol metabolism
MSSAAAAVAPVKTMVEAMREAIVAALRASGGNIDGAAWMLNVSRSTVYRKIRELEIEPREWMR